MATVWSLYRDGGLNPHLIPNHRNAFFRWISLNLVQNFFPLQNILKCQSKSSSLKIFKLAISQCLYYNNTLKNSIRTLRKDVKFLSLNSPTYVFKNLVEGSFKTIESQKFLKIFRRGQVTILFKNIKIFHQNEARESFGIWIHKFLLLISILRYSSKTSPTIRNFGQRRFVDCRSSWGSRPGCSSRSNFSMSLTWAIFKNSTWW